MVVDADNPLTWKIPTLLYLGYNYKPSCFTSAPAPEVPAPETWAMHPLGDAPHRYTILVYLQTQEPIIDIAPGLQGRYTFPLAAFVQESKLQLVGGNFFKEAGIGSS